MPARYHEGIKTIGRHPRKGPIYHDVEPATPQRERERMIREQLRRERKRGKKLRDHARTAKG